MAGSFYDELHVGQMLTHAIRRTVTEAGSNWFSALTHNPAALRLDKEYCRTKTEFEQHVVNSCFTLGLMVGISVSDKTLGTSIAYLGRDEVRFHKQLVHRDTVPVESEVFALRDSGSPP